MKVLYLDCFSGISGDMTVGALCDLGVKPSTLEWELSKVEIGDFHMHFERKQRKNIEGVKFSIHTGAVHTHDQDEHEHDHECCGGGEGHEHSHGHSHDEQEHVHGHSHEHAEGDDCGHKNHGHEAGHEHAHSHDCGHEHHDHEHEHDHGHAEEDKHEHLPPHDREHGDEVGEQHAHHQHEHHAEGSHSHHHHHGAGHVHEHDHGHDREHIHGRTHAQIRELIEKSELSPFVKKHSLGIFQRIAIAEGKIHGVPAEDVGFHEVGALDSIADIICACVGIEALGVEKVYVSSLHEGRGWVNCAHGRFPLPAPATFEILKGVPLGQIDEPHELITPTGAAIVAEFAESFGLMPRIQAERIGYGIGKRNLEARPNVLRAVLGELVPE